MVVKTNLVLKTQKSSLFIQVHTYCAKICCLRVSGGHVLSAVYFMKPVLKTLLLTVRVILV